MLAVVSIPAIANPKAQFNVVGLVCTGAVIGLALLVASRMKEAPAIAEEKGPPASMLDVHSQRRRATAKRLLHSLALILCAGVLAYLAPRFPGSRESEGILLLEFLLNTAAIVIGLIYFGVALANLAEAMWLSWRIRKLRKS